MFETIIGYIPSLGFPIVCVIALAWFCWRMIETNREDNKNSLAELQQENKAREDKLYDEIAECRSINSKAIETIASYAEKLEHIQQDVSDIKTDITIIKTKS